MAGNLDNNVQVGRCSIGKLLGLKILSVPPSQRSYAWKQEHADDLFKDIQVAIADPDYFVGSIITIKQNGRICIYDGQQRLATTMILVAAIRDSLVARANELDATTTESDFLTSNRRGSASADPHMVLNSQDNDYFVDRVLLRATHIKREKLVKSGRPDRESHRRIDSVAAHAKSFVDSLTENRNAADANKQLLKWLDFIESKLSVVWVQVLDERTAYTVFETMNDRGLSLSSADLLKNFLHSQGGNRKDHVIQKWEAMCGVIETIAGEENNVVEFVRCFWVMKNGQTRTRSLFDQIKEVIVNHAQAVELVNDLEKTVQYYAAIILSSHEKLAGRGQSVKSDIATLDTLGVTQLRPMILAAFIKFRPREFELLLNRCIAWSVRFLVKGTPSGTLEGYYARNALEIWKGNFTKSDEVEASMRLSLPDDATFEPAFSTVVVRSARIAKYYLSALQITDDGAEDQDYTPNNVTTLEHVLPTSPSSAWDDVAAEDLPVFRNRLGNLVLLNSKVNGRIGNKSYREKKAALVKEACFSLTKLAGMYKKWGVTEIEDRQKKLAKLAVKTWPLRPSAR